MASGCSERLRVSGCSGRRLRLADHRVTEPTTVRADADTSPESSVRVTVDASPSALTVREVRILLKLFLIVLFAVLSIVARVVLGYPASQFIYGRF